MLKQLISVALGSFVAFASTSILVNAQAQELKMSTTLSEAGQWTLMAGPLTLHYSDINRDADSTEEKHKYVWLVGGEKMLTERYFAGAGNQICQRSRQTVD